ncbi:MAG: cobalamin biosynthesis protein CobW [Hyphomicrobiales bacterium]|nr:cobalamin biosynthesis protein CobW [Hyphomicrobiales bacterium]
MPANPPSRIPATVITGFLGAGKTTLIRHLLQNAGGRRIALIINEFGDVGVDRGLLTDCGDEACRPEDIVELANGCICCTVADDFIPTMQALLARDPAPEHIVIETSGLALPQPLVRAFNWPEVRARVTVDGVVTVVDACAVAEGRFAADEDAIAAQRAADASLDHESPLEELFEDQVSCADLIILNKADLVGPAQMAAVMETVLRDKRPGVEMVRAAMGRVPPEVLIGLNAAAEDDAANRLSHHDREGEEHDHDDFETFVLAVPPVADVKPFADKLADAAALGVLRAKGFLAVEDKPMRLVAQAVGPRVETYFDRPWRDGETSRGRLVVIGLKGLDRAAIAAALGCPPP